MDFTNWDAGIHRADPNALQHFGVQGMKWGQRRFQNEDGSLTSLGKERYGHGGTRSARGTKRDLNKLDREHSNAVARRDDYQTWVDKRKAKEEKRARKRGEKVHYSDKVKKYEAKAKEYDALAKKNEALTERIIQKSLKKGYSIKTKDTMRSVNKGRNAVASILSTAAGVALAATTGTGFYMVGGELAPGKKYKVKNDGLGLRTHQGSRKLILPSKITAKKRQR